MDKERSPHDRKSWYLFRRVFNDFGFGKDIRVYGISNWIIDLYRSTFKQQNIYDKKVENRNYHVSLLSIVISFARDIVVYGFLIFWVIDGRIDIADFTMLFLAIAAFSLLMQQISTDIAFVHSQDERFIEYRKFMNLPEEETKSGKMSAPTPMQNGYEIEFKNIWFRYPRQEKYIFENFNLKIADGEKLAIVGLNGAGKTTLVKLLTRLYDPEKGEILLNGTNIKEIDILEYRKIISAVFQEITLIATTLAGNLTYIWDGYDSEQLEKAMKLSGFYDKYKTFENGMDTQVLKYLHSDGIDFSGGEIQKIAITRALYKDGSIMILDEPTASLDAIAEYELYNGLAELSKGKTVIFVSHRLASTSFCDRIALIGEGGIIEIGTHEELANQKGVYYEMFETQAKAYQ